MTSQKEKGEKLSGHSKLKHIDLDNKMMWRRPETGANLNTVQRLTPKIK